MCITITHVLIELEKLSGSNLILFYLLIFVKYLNFNIICTSINILSELFVVPFQTVYPTVSRSFLHILIYCRQPNIFIK